MSNKFGNILPKEFSLQTLGSNQTHDSLASDYQDTPKSFYDLQTLDTDQTHDDLKLSGYQYTSPGSSIQLNVDEYQELSDNDLNLAVSSSVDETQELTDSAITLPLTSSDSGAVSEEVELIVTVAVDETQPLGESFTQSLDEGPEVGPVSEEVSLVITVNIDEYFGLTDNDVEAFSLVEFVASTRIQVQEIDIFDSTTIIHNQSIVNSTFTTNLNVITDTLVATVNASSASNAFLPTVSVDGIKYIENPETTGPVSNTGVYINIVPTGLVPNNNLCELFNWSVNLSFGGGTWSISSQNRIGNKGDDITLFGMLATITEVGRVSSDSVYGWETSGIFGVRNMHKQLQVLATVETLYGLTGTQSVQSPHSSEWKTLRDLAAALAGVVGVTVNWAAKDALLTDLLIQSGMTGTEALNALAAVVGAIVVWDGQTTYTVIEPDRGLRGNGLVLPKSCLKISISSKDLFFFLSVLTSESVPIVSLYRLFSSSSRKNCASGGRFSFN